MKYKILPRYVLGVRTAAILETIVFLFVVCLIDYFFGNGDRFLGVSPHPFSIIILLVAVQYGTPEAIVSTILSTIVLYAWNIPPQKINDTLFDYQFGLIVVPMLWFLASFIIGELRMRLEQKNHETEMELHEVKKQASTISKEYEVLKETKENFEAYLVSQYNTITNTYKSLKALEVLNPSQILLNLEEVVQGALNIEKFSVYAMGDMGFEVVTSHGWNKGEPFSLRIKQDNPLFWEIYGEHRIVCVVNEDDAKILQKEGVLAGPIIDKETKEILGMLKIEKMRFMDLNVSSIETFKSLCELIGIAYSNARDYIQVKANSIYQLTDPPLFSNLFYELQKESYHNLCQNLKQPLSMISLHCIDRMSEAEEEKMLAKLTNVITPLLKTPTMLFAGARKQKTVRILLPATSKEDSEAFSHKILDRLLNDNYLNEKIFKFNIEMICNPHSKGESSQHG